MKKTHIVAFALFAVCAFSALSVASAFAGEWLVNGAPLTAPVKAETEGELELKLIEGEATALSAVLCSGILDGTIGPNGTDEISELLNLEMVAISLTALSGTALSCNVFSTSGGLADCILNTLASVWAVNLPWNTKIELMTNGEVLDIITKEPGYSVQCETPLGLIEETCTGNTSAVLTNAATTPASVLGTFNTGSERAKCAVLGVGKGQNLGSGNTWGIGAELERLTTATS
jgi:hypothetical protein